MSTQTYDFTLTAGGSQVILAEGDYFRVMSSTGQVEVLMSDGSRYGPIAAGQGQKGKHYTRLTVRDRSGAGNVGFIMVAGEEFVDNRVNGEVSVIDGGKARTIANSAFAWALGAPAIAATYAACQLYNPVGSGKRVIVKAYSVVATAPTYVQTHTNLAALANLGAALVNSKHRGGVMPIAVSRYENFAVTTPSPAFIDYIGMPVGAQSYPRLLQEPVVLEPGAGFIVEAQTANVQMNASFEWTEEAV